MQRLTSRSELPVIVQQPQYKPEDHAVGIVHLGLGAFHRAHQAVYTDDALAISGGDWRITGVSLRSDTVAKTINPQDGRYLLLQQGVKLPEDGQLRLIGSVAAALSLQNDREAITAALCSASTKIVSLTITEKAYLIDREAGTMQLDHVAVKHDLLNPQEPETAIGLIVMALSQRFKNGLPPFTLLCCDNLPDNGPLLRMGVVDFAQRVEPGLAQWISDTVSFPSTMVDRITPAMTTDIIESVAERVGFEDQGVVVTESFSQWVIEDDFPTGRPDWDKAGAVFVDDVSPFEKMKLRMLNGAHSLLAYTGFLADCETVSDAMAFAPISALVKAHLSAAAKTLPSLEQINYDDYAVELCERFENPKLKHATYQIAMDGTEKLPQRLLEAAVETLQAGGDQKTFVIAVAAWIRYCLGVNASGESYELRDPREAEIKRVLEQADYNASKVSGLMKMPGLFPEELLNNDAFVQEVINAFEEFQAVGVRAALQSFK